jgi:Type IV pilin-like G and H, putative
MQRSLFKPSPWLFGSAIALLTGCQTTAQPPNPALQTPENKTEIDRYLAAKIIQPSYGGTVLCSHSLLGAELEKQPQKLYIAMLCQEYYIKDGESLQKGTGTLGPVALAIAQSGTSLKVLSHQITESKIAGPKLADIFPADILPAAQQASSAATPELLQSNATKAERYVVQAPIIKRLSGTWIGPSRSPLASPTTQEFRTFTPQGTTYSILRNDWDFLAAPSLQAYQINSPPNSEPAKPWGISMGQHGIFEFSAQDQQLKLNLATPPDRPPTTFTGPTSITFNRQTDKNLQIMANIEGQAAEILARHLQQTLAQYIEAGKFDPTSLQLLQYSSKSSYYTIQAQILDADRVQITAIASPSANLPSFTAGILRADLAIGVPGSKKAPMLIGGICRSDQPSSTAPAMPTLPENQEVVTCPAGSRRLMAPKRTS